VRWCSGGRECRATPDAVTSSSKGVVLMRSRLAWTIFVLVAVTVVVMIVIAVMRFNLTALAEPGAVETRTATLAKDFVIRRASRRGIPRRPVDTKASAEAGGEHYGFDCSVCHADDGRAQRPPGEWMYPRASDLTSKQVQSYSDEELFWIIQNGIRYTGMPAFSKVESSDHIWDLVNYVRTLPGALRSENSTRTLGGTTLGGTTLSAGPISRHWRGSRSLALCARR
jgi:mono/diheme cytochrome c family protein